MVALIKLEKSKVSLSCRKRSSSFSEGDSQGAKDQLERDRISTGPCRVNPRSSFIAPDYERTRCVEACHRTVERQ
ncbi:hypothetical protein KI387_031345, partial [Taxus chinensis]